MVRASQAVGGFAVLAVAIALLVLGAGSAMGSVVLPAPEALPATVVAVVPTVPGARGRITLAELRHALLLKAVSEGRGSAPKPGGPGYEKSKVAVVQSLLEGAWIVGQATEWRISVTHRQVAREVASVKRESFKDGAEFREFLRESRYTRRDVNERVEVQMLSERLQGVLLRRIGAETDSKAEEQRALQEFLDEFNERWRGRTVCAPDYATSRCSNGPAS